MKRSTLATLAALALLGARPAAPQETTEAEAEPRAADASADCETCAPEFALTTTDGEPFTRASLVGRVTLLHFFRTTDIWPDDLWSGLQGVTASTRKQPVQIVGVSLDRDEARARRFAHERGLSWPICVDADRKVSGAFGVGRLPYQLVVDHEGRVVYRHASWSEAQALELRHEITRALADLKKAQKAEAKAAKEEERARKKDAAK